MSPPNPIAWAGWIRDLLTGHADAMVLSVRMSKLSRDRLAAFCVMSGGVTRSEAVDLLLERVMGDVDHVGVLRDFIQTGAMPRVESSADIWAQLRMETTGSPKPIAPPASVASGPVPLRSVPPPLPGRR